MLINRICSLSTVLNKSVIFNTCNKCKFQTNISKRFSKNYSNTPNSNHNLKLRSTLYYITAAGILVIGLSYAAVPLYRIFCQSSSYGGTTSTGHDTSKIETMAVIKHRPIRIRFNADTASSMRWNFKPQQNEITVF